MQRASSIANMKIDFNPQQAKTGHSSIDKLPIRKCSSSKSISQISQTQQKMVLQAQQYNIDMLKRINQSLERQNTYLKKQLDYFTQACSSRRVSLTTLSTLPSRKNQDSGYRDKILGRIDCKNDTESTGLFSNSSRKVQYQQNTISDIYTKYQLKKILPKPQTIKLIVHDFIQSIQENYLKLKTIVQEINNRNKQNQKIPKQTNQIVSMLEMIVVFCKNVKMGKNVLKERDNKEKDKIKIKSNKNQCKEDRVQEIINQFTSTNDLIMILEGLIKTVIKNAKCIKYLKTSILYSKLLAKVAKSQ